VVMRLVDFGQFPLTWLWKRVKVSVCVPKERERDRVLFGVGVGDECVDHEIAVGTQVSSGSIVSDLRGGRCTHTCSKAGSEDFGWWTSRAGIAGWFRWRG